ncbi:transcription termination/antitermination protein NusG [Labrys portucalensis]|uniref:Transcription termination/antitermination protein NusG n=1 Tax=Labrys neptuniae TaxID=376174 RepID=A0ABV6Z8M5_9HYPH
MSGQAVTHWHVVYVAVGGGGLAPLRECDEQQAEAKRRTMVEAALQRRGFATFRPQFRLERMKRRRVLTPKGRVTEEVKVGSWRDLFPRYLFVGMSGKLSCWDIRQVEDVDAILYSDGAPAVFLPEQIEDLMMAVDAGLFDQLIGRETVFNAGQHVQIIGTLPGKIVEKQSVKEGDKVTVAIELFGREYFERVPLDKLKAAS